MSRRRLRSALAGTALLASCAAPPENVAVLPPQTAAFEAMDCSRLMTEKLRLTTDFNVAAGRQSNSADMDKGIAIAAGLFFTPALLVIAATGDHANEVRDARAQYDGVIQVARAKRCLATPPADPIDVVALKGCTTSESVIGNTVSHRAVLAPEGGWCALVTKPVRGPATKFDSIGVAQLPSRGQFAAAPATGAQGQVLLYHPDPDFAADDRFTAVGILPDQRVRFEVVATRTP